MTDRYSTLTVILEEPMRDDDAQVLMDAIRLMKGVLAVDGNIQDPMLEGVALAKAKASLLNQIIGVLS